MAKPQNQSRATTNDGATVGYEAELWRMADVLRGSMDAAEYKHVVLGLIFLKYISDAFEEQHAKLVADKVSGADPEGCSKESSAPADASMSSRPAPSPRCWSRPSAGTRTAPSRRRR